MLTVFFVMLSEVLIFVPSVARDRLAYLEDRIDAARLAVFALEATPDNIVSQALANQLLADVGAHGIAVHEEDATLMIDTEMPPMPNATFDLRGVCMSTLIRDAVMTLPRSDNRILRVHGRVAEGAGRRRSRCCSTSGRCAPRCGPIGGRLFGISLVISLITAALVYVSLQWLLVAPMRRLTQGMMKFREDPADATRVIKPARRRDELGQAERELAMMQETVRQALRQKERLAALGAAVTKINHDLKNILATMRLLADGISASAAPELTPGRAGPRRCDRSRRRAHHAARSTTRARRPPLHRSRFALAGLAEEIAEMEFGEGADGLRHREPGRAVDHRRRRSRSALPRAAQSRAKRGAGRRASPDLARRRRARRLLLIEVADDGPGCRPRRARICSGRLPARRVRAAPASGSRSRAR